MSGLRTKFNEAMKDAMKSKDQMRLGTVRLIMAALKDRDIAARSHGNMDGIGEDEILDLLQKMIKQRRESISMYEQGGRLELAQQEADEIMVIEHFLPQQLTQEEIETIVGEVIQSEEAASLRDMGKVMAVLKDRYAGQMDFSKASTIAKQKLAS